MNGRRKKLTAALGAVVGAVLLCGSWAASAAGATGAAGKELVIYSGRGERFTRPIAKAFAAKTGIRVRTLVGSGGQLLARIREEGRRTRADIFMTNYAGVLEKGRREGLFQSYDSPMLAHVPARYVGPGNQWFGASVRARVIVYNTKLVDPARLGSILDLAQPEWKGRLGITVSTNGSFVGGLATMLAQHGQAKTRKFLVGIKANAGENVFPKHTPIVSAVARGEIAVGLVNHYYFYRAITKNGALPIGILYPDGDGAGVPTTISGLAILTHAKRVAAARRFVDFVLSEQGQKLFAEVNFEFPVSDAVARHPLLPGPGQVRLAPVEQALKVERIDQAVLLIKTVGLL